MNRLERGDTYSRGAIAFHWVIAALVLFNLSLGFFHDALPRDWKVMPLHKVVGITVLVLSLGRLAWRLTHRPPALPVAMPEWERLASKATHWGFYALLVIMPLSGWTMSSNPEKPRPVDFFGLFELPVLPVSKALSGIGHEAHELLGWVFLGLLVLHVGAALRHHFLLRDSVVHRMVPWVKPRN